MSGSPDLLNNRDKGGVLVAGCNRVARLPGIPGKVGGGPDGRQCFGPSMSSRIGTSAAYSSRAEVGSPAFPVHEARLARTVIVSS